ncbi:MAG: DUF3592 domain-containing protein [Pseudomonadota bacterium]|nr:DUF3592 domain-containing protein [Pseudomonadota bacterium]
MSRTFWRMFYAIKYWRVFLQPKEPDEIKPATPKGAGIGTRIAMALFFMLPVLIGVGFGYLALEHGRRLEAQTAVDRDGVPVTATVVATQIEEVKHRSTIVAHERSTPDPSYFCHIAVTYQPPGNNDTLRKQFRLEDDSICKRYKAGMQITGRLLPDRPDVFVLDEGRLDTYWWWISVALFGLFAVLPVFLLLKNLLNRARRP